MEDNYINTEIDKDSEDVINDFKNRNKLHKDWLPFTTYDMVQCGYPKPNHGEMVARYWGGTDEEGFLLPSDGMWCKVNDVKKYINIQNKEVQFMPTSPDWLKKSYKPLREPYEERDHMYSPLADGIMTAINRNLNEYSPKSVSDVWTLSLFPERLTKEILRLVEEQIKRGF